MQWHCNHSPTNMNDDVTEKQHYISLQWQGLQFLSSLRPWAHTHIVAVYVCQRLLFLKQANHKHQSATTQQCVLKPFIRHVHFSPSCESSSEHLSPPLRLNGSHLPNACEILLISCLFLDACHYPVCATMSCDYDTACLSSERADTLLISLFFSSSPCCAFIFTLLFSVSKNVISLIKRFSFCFIYPNNFLLEALLFVNIYWISFDFVTVCFSKVMVSGYRSHLPLQSAVIRYQSILILEVSFYTVFQAFLYLSFHN